MAKDVSIAFIAKDNLTNSINSMRNSTRNLTKDISEYKKIQNDVFNRKIEVKYDLTKAKEELKALTKAIKDNVEGSEQDWKKQQKKIQELENEYKNLNKAAKEASNAERRLSEDISKTKNTANIQGSGGGLSKLGSVKDFMAGIAGSDLIKMVSQELVNYGSFQATRTYGQGAGETIANVGGGAIQGAMAGALLGNVIPVIGPAIGAAIGGAIGAGTGALKDKAAKQEKIDDLFREDVKGLFNMTKEKSKSELDEGIKSATKREKDLISFSTLFGGDDIAKKFMGNAQKFASETPFETEDLVNVAKKLSAYGYKPDEIVDKNGNGIMKTVGNAGSALGMSNEDMSWVATSMGRMRSSDKATLEYLNPLIERGIPAVEYLAKASGKDIKQIYEMLSKGQIGGKQAVQVITDYMNKDYDGNMDKQSKTTAGLMSNIEDQQAIYNMKKGEGYNEERKKGLEGQIKFHEANSKNIEKANEALGVFQARLDNLKDEKINLAIKNAMESKEFNEADEAKKGMIIQKARVDGMLEFRKTDEFKLQQQADLALVDGIRTDASLLTGYYEAGVAFGNELSKGLEDETSKKVRSIVDGISSFFVNPFTRHRELPYEYGPTGPISQSVSVANLVKKDEPKTEGYKGVLNGYGNGPSLLPSPFKFKAVGTDRVPYDNYPALLHEGEKVLTKAQVNTVPVGGITINMNNTVREEADIDKIVSALTIELTKHQAGYGGEYK